MAAPNYPAPSMIGPDMQMAIDPWIMRLLLTPPPQPQQAPPQYPPNMVPQQRMPGPMMGNADILSRLAAL